MRSSSMVAGAAAVAVAALVAVPVTASASAPARAQSTPTCLASQLSGAVNGGGGAAGSVFWTLVLTNHSATACHLTGFPGVSMLDASGRQIGQPAVREHSTYQRVELKPGASASDTVRTVNHHGTCLPTSAELRVYPPGDFASMTVPARITECFATFTITPLTSGTNGNPVDGSGTSGGSGGTPAPVPTPAPTATHASGGQVVAVPSGAPDTGLATPARHSGDGWTAAAGAGAAAVAGGLGVAAVRRRRARG